MEDYRLVSEWYQNIFYFSDAKVTEMKWELLPLALHPESPVLERLPNDDDICLSFQDGFPRRTVDANSNEALEIRVRRECKTHRTGTLETRTFVISKPTFERDRRSLSGLPIVPTAFDHGCNYHCPYVRGGKFLEILDPQPVIYTPSGFKEASSEVFPSHELDTWKKPSIRFEPDPWLDDDSPSDSFYDVDIHDWPERLRYGRSASKACVWLQEKETYAWCQCAVTTPHYVYGFHLRNYEWRKLFVRDIHFIKGDDRALIRLDSIACPSLSSPEKGFHALQAELAQLKLETWQGTRDLTFGKRRSTIFSLDGSATEVLFAASKVARRLVSGQAFKG
ncbi:hypothetical protein OQA88_7746 [Cercophora sp. LCS_1]